MHLIHTDPTLNVLLAVISRANQGLMVGVMNESRRRSQHIAQDKDVLKDLNSRKVITIQFKACTENG